MLTHRPLVFGDDVLRQQTGLELLGGLHQPLHRRYKEIRRRHGRCECVFAAATLFLRGRRTKATTVSPIPNTILVDRLAPG